MNDVLEGPGQALQAARESMEISVREVADVLNLPIATIEAIEVNDYENLPAAVFTRGYIRAYAKLLELDADPVVARFSVGDDETRSAETDTSSPFPVLRIHPQLVPAAAGLAALIALILITVWLWPAADERERIATEAPRGIETTAEGPEVSGRRAPPAETAQQTLNPELVVEPPIEIRSVAEESFIVTTDVDALSTSRRITPMGGDRLEFRFTEDCWVEIKSATGASLYSDLSRSGDTLELVGQPPFRILLGYAPGVSMSFNAEDVALAPHTRNNVANLVLGQ